MIFFLVHDIDGLDVEFPAREQVYGAAAAFFAAKGRSRNGPFMMARLASGNNRNFLDDQIRPCDRWFLVEPGMKFAHDEVYLSIFGLCLGPVVFRVPGGIQPGRWRLVIELEESTANIPFVLEVDD